MFTVDRSQPPADLLQRPRGPGRPLRHADLAECRSLVQVCSEHLGHENRFFHRTPRERAPWNWRRRPPARRRRCRPRLSTAWPPC